jgi:hypothetical protein
VREVEGAGGVRRLFATVCLAEVTRIQRGGGGQEQMGANMGVVNGKAVVGLSEVAVGGNRT